ncbi:MAG: dUTP diphosphatase [bacterium]|nr:dUTP diphosphatase [bacterium]MBK8130471.1 dUTP diphosphatase [bacterium]
MTLTVEITRLPHAPTPLPAYASEGAAGMDLCVAANNMMLSPGERALVPTGFQIAIPVGYEGQVRLRSGFARRTGCVLPNAPGTIDSDYRGEIMVLIMNASREAVRLERGERIAQLIVAPVMRVEWLEVPTLPDSARGSGGFGSTGR